MLKKGYRNNKRFLQRRIWRVLDPLGLTNIEFYFWWNDSECQPHLVRFITYTIGYDKLSCKNYYLYKIYNRSSVYTVNPWTLYQSHGLFDLKINLNLLVYTNHRWYILVVSIYVYKSYDNWEQTTRSSYIRKFL